MRTEGRLRWLRIIHVVAASCLRPAGLGPGARAASPASTRPRACCRTGCGWTAHDGAQAGRYVIVLVALNIGSWPPGCCGGPLRAAPGDPKPEDTSHVWDGDITEYNKAPPRWWINLFYLTIAFRHRLPGLVSGLSNFASKSRWTSAGESMTARPYNAKLPRRPSRRQGPVDRRARPRPGGVEAGPLDLQATPAPPAMARRRRARSASRNLSDKIGTGRQSGRVLETVDEGPRGRDGSAVGHRAYLTGWATKHAADNVVAYVRTPSTLGRAREQLHMAGRFRQHLRRSPSAVGKGNQQPGAPDPHQTLSAVMATVICAAVRDHRQRRHASMPAHLAHMETSAMRRAYV